MNLSVEEKQLWTRQIMSGEGISRFFPPDFPTIVCLCGSARFADAYREANLRETVDGNIVLSVGCSSHAAVTLSPADKAALDELHKRKIDLCDRVLILNVGGYIGSSTRSEIEYAMSMRKPICYLEPITEVRE